MNYPETFAEWSRLFDDFKNRINDTDTLEAAYKGIFEPSGGTAEIWAEEFLDALNERLKLAQKRFDRDLSHARSDTEIQAALSSLKRELKLIYKFAGLPCADGIKSLDDRCDMVVKAAENMESSLLNSANTDRSGKLAVFVRNARITRLTQ